MGAQGESEYLKSNVGVVLQKALLKVALESRLDPIQHLASLLHAEADNIDAQKRLDDALAEEVAAVAAVEKEKQDIIDAENLAKEQATTAEKEKQDAIDSEKLANEQATAAAAAEKANENAEAKSNEEVTDTESPSEMNDAASKGDERVEAVEGDAVLNTAVTAASGAMDTEVDTASGGDTGGSVDNTANSGETDTSPDQDITADSKPTVETSEDSAANSNEEEASEPSPAVVDSVADDPAPDETAAAVEEEPNS